MLREEIINAPYIDKEKREKFVKLIENCKELKDTKYKVGNCSKGQIIKLYLKEEENKIRFNGDINYSDNDLSENRCIEGTIYLDEEIIIDMHITRLCVEEHKIYTTIDVFGIEHKTIYNLERGKER